MKKIVTLALILCISLCFWGCDSSESDAPIYSTQKADDDFSDLFRLNDMQGSSLAALTVTDIKEVQDVVEYYDVYDTTYTKVTATLDRDFSDNIEQETITIMILGTTDNFPQREKMVQGRSYLLRLERWVHESGPIWLLSPLESTYLRIFDGEILVHESANDLNYKRALTPDEFAEQYKNYQKDNPPNQNALRDYYSALLQKVKNYDYQNKELAYTLSAEAIAARLKMAEQLNK